MPTTSILKVDSPSCIWARFYPGPNAADTTKQYDHLMAQMNLFYHDVTQDLQKLKLKSLEEGQVCVVYWPVIKLWCRALVESVIMDSVSCKARCLLLDHGERLVVSSNQIRVAVQSFLQLPFLVKKFHLAGIKPMTLQVYMFEEKAKLIPSTQWDSSASLYLHNLLQVSTQTEVVLLDSESESFPITLYVTVRNIKICVNDDLVAKKFALYDSQLSDNDGLDEADQEPIMLSSSILRRKNCMITKNLTALAQPLPVMSSRSAAVGGNDFLMSPSTSQTTMEKLNVDEQDGSSIWPACIVDSPWTSASQNSESSQYQQLVLKTTEEGNPSSGRSKFSSDSAATESDSSEKISLSLAAALRKKLSLLRSSEFLTSGSTFQQTAPSVNLHEELKKLEPEETPSECFTGQEVNGRSGAQCLGESSQNGYVADEETSSFSPYVESEAPEKTCRSEEDMSSHLLEWLNPDPLDPDLDAAVKVVVPNDPSRDTILVHSALPVEPCSSLVDAPILDSIRWMLQKKQHALCPADYYSWPAVARGCNVVTVSPNGDQPLSYLAPLLTHILLNSIFTSHTSTTGPISVLLCPGWEKAQIVYDLLEEMKVTATLHPIIVLLGLGKDEAKAVRIPKNCLLLVTTPFSLVRLLSCHCFLFLRMCHLVLDEADQLFTLAPDEMATILQHFQKVSSNEDNTSCSQQLVSVAKRWTSHMVRLIVNHMPSPSIVVTVPEEIALYADVQQIVLMTLESSKSSTLLGTLDLTPAVGQKTLIITSSVQEVEDVSKAVSSKAAFCLKAHEGISQQFDTVMLQWRKALSPGTHLFLVTTTACLKSLGIRDATRVIHYDFPVSPKVFGSRLFCLADNFRNLSEHTKTDSCPRLAQSVLLISETSTSHGVGILRYMERTNALLPSELQSFVQGVLKAREDQKTDQPLCRYLKSYGVCRDSSVCPDRHGVTSHLDRSVLPTSGLIEVLPLYVKTASVFYGRIVRKDDARFQCMVAEMTSYYADTKPAANKVLEGELYAVQEDEQFHRVKILSVPDRSGLLFYSLLVHFIDVGKEDEVKSYQLLELPEQFHSLPGQAVEIVVCRVKPAYGEIDWHPKVTRAISQKIQGVKHQARAVFSLGNTVFVDPMVRVSRLPGLKTVINEYSVQSEILNTGMAVSNPQHLDLLRALCQEVDHLSGSGDRSAFLEARIKSEEEVLAEALSNLSEPPKSELHSPVSPLIEAPLPVLPAQQAAKADPHPGPVCDEDSLVMRSNAGKLSPVVTNVSGLHPSVNGNDSNSQQVISTHTDCHNTTKSFHPQVRWFETRDSLIVTVKLINPEDQHCDFYVDRVVYSGRVNGQIYIVDLELQASISAERCSWEMKSNEPVLKLVKQEQGCWERFLRKKNIFVSYDMEHFEEDEESTPNGERFVGDTGDINSSMYSESDGESD